MHFCRLVELDFLTSAPMQFSNFVELAVTPQELWQVLERADTWPRWAGVIKKVTYTSPAPHGVGTTRTVQMLGGLRGDEKFLAWEPGAHMAFRFEAASLKELTAFLEDYRIVATPTGCRLTWALSMELSGASRHFTPLSRPITNLMFKRYLSRLQRLVAAGVPAQAGRAASA